MWTRRLLLLLLLLFVSVDLGATVLPAAQGFEWDDEEEAVQARDGARSRRQVEHRAPVTTAVRPLVAAARGDAGPAVRRPAHRLDRSEPHRGSDAASRDPASPGEDH